MRFPIRRSRFSLARRSLPALLALLPSLLLAPGAAAATRFTIHGAGFGHGIGMSQYGAQGYALHGAGYRRILAHYYRGTGIGQTDPRQRVRVLLVAGEHSFRFTHATVVSLKHINPSHTYTATTGGGRVTVRDAGSGKLVGRFGSARFGGRGWVVMANRSLLGISGGGWRGYVRITASGDAVNEVRLDDYVKGIVGVEETPSWKPEALKAQAVAARTYAITAGGASGLLYDDTRSQAYGGVNREYPETTAAVKATRGQVVTYNGAPVITYFFSTSGGRTENVENSFIGATPEPWLVSVNDPYDSISPLHRWIKRMTFSTAAGDLRGFVRGRFKGVTVLKRGRSPRIVRAAVLGTGGRTVVSGSVLRSAFNGYDTWMRFTAIATRKGKPKRPGGTGGGSGGAKPHAASAARLGLGPTHWHPSLTGTVIAPARFVIVQHWTGRRWVRAARLRLARDGTYAWTARDHGRYRVLAAGDPGAPLTL